MTTYFLELGWKSTVVLVLATIVAYAIRKQSAGARHLVWKLACLSLLVLPVGQAWMPGWNMLPEEWFMVSFDPSPTEQRAIAATHNPPDTVTKNQAASTEPAQTRIPTNPFPDPVSTPNVRVRTREETVIVGGEPRIFRPIDRVEMPSAILWRFTAVLKWVVVLWGSIACLLMLRLISSVFMLWRKTSQLPMMTDEPLVTLVASLRSSLRLRRSVDVRLSTPETMPMVWGLWQPVIIVPETITSWPIEQQRSVLLHELAHVKRSDPLWQVVVELTKVIYWPQPLLWFALRQIERFREQACDDLVLNSGVCAADYARSLLDVVSQGRLRRMWPAVGVAIVSTPSIELRLKTILDRTVNRFAVSRTMATRLLIFSCLAGISLMIFRLIPDRNEASYAVVEHEDGSVSIRGQSVDSQGKPVSSAKISLYSSSIPDGLVGEVVTDKDGQFHFDHVTLSRLRDVPRMHLVGIAEGYGIAVSRLALDQTQRDFRLSFPVERVFEGQAVAADGTPIDQAKVQLQSIKRGEDNLMNVIRQLPVMAAFYSQADGKFRIRSLPGDCDIVMSVSHPGIWRNEITLDALPNESQINSEPVTVILTGKNPAPTPHFKDGLFDLRVSGRAVDLDGQPISGATIFVTSVRTEKKLLAQTTTNDEGHYRFESVALPMNGPGEIQGAFEVYGTHPDYAVAFEPRLSLRSDANWMTSDESATPLVKHPTPQEFDITLAFSEPKKLNGVIHDESNQPIEGAVVELIRLAKQVESPRTSPDAEFRTLGSQWSPFTRSSQITTDSNGEFVFEDLPSNCHATFRIKAKGYVTRQYYEVTLEGPSDPERKDHLYSKAVDLTLQEAIPITVEFTDEVTGSPIAGLLAYCHRTWTSGRDHAVTDRDGRISLIARRGENVVYSFLSPEVPYLPARASIDVDTESNEIFKVSLVPAAVLKLRIVDVDTHHGVEGFSIWKKHGNGKVRYFEDRYDRAVGHPLSYHPVSDADGVIIVHLPAGKQTLGFGLDHGPFLHGYRYDFIGTAGATFDFVPGRTEEFEVKVRKAQRKDGKAIGEQERKTSHNAEMVARPLNQAVAEMQAETKNPATDEKPVVETPVEVTPRQKERRQIVLEVYDEDGKPVQGAKVDILGLRTLIDRGSSYTWSEEFHGSKPDDVSNEKGEITIDYPEFVVEQMRTSVLSILVEHPEFAAKNHELDLLKQNRRDAPVYLMRQRVPLQRGVVYQISFAGENTPVRPMSTHVMFSDLWRGDKKFSFQPPNTLVSSRRDDQPRIAQVAHRTESGQILFSNVISASDWIKEGELRIVKDVLLSPGHSMSGRIDEAVPRPVKNGSVLAQCVYLDSSDPNNQKRLSFADAVEIQPDGAFKFDSLPRDVPIQLVAMCDGWWSSQPKLKELRNDPEFEPYLKQLQGIDGVSLWPQLVSSSQSDGVFIPMEKTNSVTLKCLDPEGKPLTGAKVSVYPNLTFYHHGSFLLGHSWSAAKDWIGVDENEIQAQQLERHHASVKLWTRTTDEDGLTSFESLPGITYVYGSLEHPEYQLVMPVGSAHRIVNVPVSGAVEPFIIRTERIGENLMGELAPTVEEADEVEAPAENENAYSVSGSIRDGEEKPLRGVKATLYQWTESSKTQTFAAETLSNDEGTFLFSDLEPPSGDRGILIESQPQTKFFDRFYKLQLTKEGYATEMTPIGYNSIESNDLELTMRKSGVLSGKVMDEQGLPLADVLVAQKFNEWPETDGLGRRARTNRNGEYRIDDLPIWNQKNAKSVDQGNGTGWMEIASPLIIDHPGYAHVEAYYQQIPGELDIVLFKENVVEGVVVNQTDQSPIRDCPIKLSKLNWTGKEGQAVTDENGRFRFNGLPASEYSLSVDSADHISFPVDFKFSGHGEVKTEVQVALTKGGWIEGSIVDHATGKPHLEITPGVKTTISIERNSTIASRPVWVRNMTVQSDGSFRTCLPPGTYLPRVPGDRNTARHFEHWDVWTKGIDVRAGETTRLDLRYHAEEIPGNPKTQAVELELPVADEVEVAKAIRRLGGWYELNDDKRIKTINMVYYDDKTRNFRLDNSQTQTDECMQWAAKCNSLTKLALTDGQVTDASMKYMSGMKLLERLIVWDAKKLTDEGIRSLRGLENLKDIHFGHAKLGDGSLETFGTLPKLEKLALQGNSFTDDGFRHLVGLTRLKSMWVGMNTPKLTDRAIDHISKLGSLEELDLQQAAISQSGFLKLSGCRELTKLMVGGVKVADSDAIDDDCLETILAFPKLKDLWITPCRLSESACDRLLNEPQISSLNIGSSEIPYGYKSNARRRYPDRIIDIHAVAQ